MKASGSLSKWNTSSEVLKYFSITINYRGKEIESSTENTHLSKNTFGVHASYYPCIK